MQYNAMVRERRFKCSHNCCVVPVKKKKTTVCPVRRDTPMKSWQVEATKLALKKARKLAQTVRQQHDLSPLFGDWSVADGLTALGCARAKCGTSCPPGAERKPSLADLPEKNSEFLDEFRFKPKTNFLTSSRSVYVFPGGSCTIRP